LRYVGHGGIRAGLDSEETGRQEQRGRYSDWRADTLPPGAAMSLAVLDDGYDAASETAAQFRHRQGLHTGRYLGHGDMPLRTFSALLEMRAYAFGVLSLAVDVCR
jgi:hypothetical protein